MNDLATVLQPLDAMQQIQSATIDDTAAALDDSRQADISLPKDLALVLLQKLAGDDAYRQSYEANPALALVAIGVPTNLIGRLSPTSIASVRLANKDTLAAALRLMRVDAAEACLCQMPPQVKLTVGGLGSAGTAPFAIPFGAD